MINAHNVDMIFNAKPLNALHIGQRDAIADAARELARTIILNTVESPVQQTALTYVRLAMLLASDSLGPNGAVG